MKKTNYVAPEVEIVEVNNEFALLAGSAGSEQAPGTDDPEEFSREFPDLFEMSK